MSDTPTPTNYTDPTTIDVAVVCDNIRNAFKMRGHTWTCRPSWPNVTVAAMADEIERLSNVADEIDWQRTERVEWKRIATMNAERLREQDAEIERLRAERDEYRQALAKIPVIEFWTGEIVQHTGTYEYTWQCPVCDSAFTGDNETCIEHADGCVWLRAVREENQQ